MEALEEAEKLLRRWLQEYCNTGYNCPYDLHVDTRIFLDGKTRKEAKDTPKG